jgi:hypothetical protein
MAAYWVARARIDDPVDPFHQTLFIFFVRGVAEPNLLAVGVGCRDEVYRIAVSGECARPFPEFKVALLDA